MNPKKILKLIEKIDYTIPYERNAVPISEFDKGFKFACNQLKGAVLAMSFSTILYYYYKIRVWMGNKKYLKLSLKPSPRPCPFNAKIKCLRYPAKEFDAKIKCLQDPAKESIDMVGGECPNIGNVKCYLRGK